MEEMHSNLPNDNHPPKGGIFPLSSIFLIFFAVFYVSSSFVQLLTLFSTRLSLPMKSKRPFLWELGF